MPTRRLFILAVYLLLWLGSLVSFVTARDFFPKEFENRNWATMPSWSLLIDDPRDFTLKTKEYISDNFGLRSSFIRLHNLLEYKVFRTSPSPLTVIGKRGRLFYAGDGTFDFDRNIAPFTGPELDQITQRFEETQAWLNKRDIAFVVIIPPDPASVYPDELPDWARPLPGKTRRQQLIEAANRFMLIPILDLVPTMRKADQEYPAYYHTDSHWTDWGAFVASSLLLNQLHTQYPKIQLPEQRDYRISSIESDGMDMTRSMGLPDLFREQKPALTAVISVPSYVKKNILNVHEFTTFCADCPNTKALVVRDSYGDGLEPNLSSHFREVTYVWTNVVPFDEIEQIHPDVVFFEFVERKLMGLPPYDVPASH